MTHEAEIQNQIRLALSEHAIMFRVNSGKVKMQDGRWFDTGVPNGFSDLCGFRKSDGKMIFIEVKNEKGRLRDVQERFLQNVGAHPVIVGVARSAEEAVRIVTESD